MNTRDPLHPGVWVGRGEFFDIDTVGFQRLFFNREDRLDVDTKLQEAWRWPSLTVILCPLEVF